MHFTKIMQIKLWKHLIHFEKLLKNLIFAPQNIILMKQVIPAIFALLFLGLCNCKNDSSNTQKEANTTSGGEVVAFDSVAHAKQMEKNLKEAQSIVYTEENFEKTAKPGSYLVGKIENTLFEKNDALANAAKSYLGTKSIGISFDNGHYGYNLVDLNGDGAQDALMYLSGSNFCEDNKCTLLIAEGDSKGQFKVHSMVQFIDLPILVCDNSSTKGWKDIITMVFDEQKTGRTMKLAYNGKNYPASTTGKDAKLLDKAVKTSGFLMRAPDSGLNMVN